MQALPARFPNLNKKRFDKSDLSVRATPSTECSLLLRQNGAPDFKCPIARLRPEHMGINLRMKRTRIPIGYR